MRAVPRSVAFKVAPVWWCCAQCLPAAWSAKLSGPAKLVPLCYRVPLLLGLRACAEAVLVGVAGHKSAVAVLPYSSHVLVLYHIGGML